MAREPTLTEAIGRRIRERREARGWSLRKFAEMSNLGSHAHLSNIETGKIAATVKTLADIAHVLEVPLRELIPEQEQDRGALIDRVERLPDHVLWQLSAFLDVLEPPLRVSRSGWRKRARKI